MKTYLFLGVAIVAEVIATSALKASNSFTVMVPTFTMIVGYAVAFYFLSLTLQTVPVGVAYAIWSGSGIVLISAFGWLVYGQKLDLLGMIGIGFIMYGVLIVNLLSKSSVHKKAREGYVFSCSNPNIDLLKPNTALNPIFSSLL